MKIRTLANLTVTAAIFAAIAVAPAFADSTSAAASTPALPSNGSSAADLLILKVNQTLANTNSLTASFSEIDSYPGDYRDLKQSGTIVLQRPQQFSIDVARFRRVDSTAPWQPSGNNTKTVSDGNSYTFVFLHPHSAQVQSAALSTKQTRSALRSFPPISQFYSGKVGTNFVDQDGPAVLLNNVVWDSHSYEVVQYPVDVDAADDGSSTTTAVAYIGSDYFVHRLVYTTALTNGSSVKEWDFDAFDLSAKPTAFFNYQPPADSTTLDKTVYGDLLADGTAAPDFTVFDKNGSPVTLSSYRGKTVILDFWATWCWPCNQSLPHTEAIGKLYRTRNVVVLAVAIRDSKLGFDLWLKRHNYKDIKFVIDPKPQGKDVASTLYNVSTTPTTYVIDPAGVVVASTAGFSGSTKSIEEAVATTVSKFSTVASAN